MASSLLGTQTATPVAPGHDVDALGPSDSSDSGSDVQGERGMATLFDEQAESDSMPLLHSGTSDASGTGERGSATGDSVRDGADILPDHVVDDPDDAGAETADVLLIDDDEDVSDDDDNPDDTSMDDESNASKVENPRRST